MQQQHDLSPARFFRRSTASVQARRGPLPEPLPGAWVHLRAWMRMERQRQACSRPLAG